MDHDGRRQFEPRPDCNLHFEKGGVPLSARELHLAYTSGKTDGITVHFTPQRLMDDDRSAVPAGTVGRQTAGAAGHVPLAE